MSEQQTEYPEKTNGEESLDLIAIDRLDGDLIVEEIKGRAVETWAYSFPGERGKAVTGLTVVGVAEACREQARHGEAIRVLRHDWRETEDAYYGIVEAGRFAVSQDGREVLLDTALGSKKELKRKSGRNGWYNDDFAFDKAISKAERNAKSKLLDSAVKASVLNEALKAGRVRPVSQPERAQAHRQQKREQEAPAPPEKVDEDEARRRFYAAATEKKLLTQAAIHLALNLDCKGRPHFEDDPQNANSCHALRETVQDLVASGLTPAEAWHRLTGLLEAGVTVREDIQETLAQEAAEG